VLSLPPRQEMPRWRSALSGFAKSYPSSSPDPRPFLRAWRSSIALLTHAPPARREKTAAMNWAISSGMSHILQGQQLQQFRPVVLHVVNSLTEWRDNCDEKAKDRKEFDDQIDVTVAKRPRSGRPSTRPGSESGKYSIAEDLDPAGASWWGFFLVDEATTLPR
jgi:hypothetical protein